MPLGPVATALKPDILARGGAHATEQPSQGPREPRPAVPRRLRSSVHVRVSGGDAHGYSGQPRQPAAARSPRPRQRAEGTWGRAGVAGSGGRRCSEGCGAGSAAAAAGGSGAGAVGRAPPPAPARPPPAGLRRRPPSPQRRSAPAAPSALAGLARASADARAGARCHGSGPLTGCGRLQEAKEGAGVDLAALLVDLAGCEEEPQFRAAGPAPPGLRGLHVPGHHWRET
ncbi:uncharacterized protein LOC118146673 [Callithrix jacchus]